MSIRKKITSTSFKLCSTLLHIFLGSQWTLQIVINDLLATLTLGSKLLAFDKIVSQPEYMKETLVYLKGKLWGWLWMCYWHKHSRSDYPAREFLVENATEVSLEIHFLNHYLGALNTSFVSLESMMWLICRLAESSEHRWPLCIVGINWSHASYSSPTLLVNMWSKQPRDGSSGRIIAPSRPCLPIKGMG